MTPGEILQQLRDARRDAGLSLRQLAEQHGTNAPVVRSHESGERAITLNALVEHASWFGLEVVLRPAGSQEADAYERGRLDAIARMCLAVGVTQVNAAPTTASGFKVTVDWDKVLDDAYSEIEEESAP
jgi:transcriptional regulator with XRE-family HTH domain